MSATGLLPLEKLSKPVAIRQERLDEFDRLLANGGIDAIVRTLKSEDEKALKRP